LQCCQFIDFVAGCVGGKAPKYAGATSRAAADHDGDSHTRVGGVGDKAPKCAGATSRPADCQLTTPSTGGTNGK